MSDMKQLDSSWRPRPEQLKDVKGHPLTQGLFLEFQYDETKALYSFKDQDYEYKGVVYPSLKRLFLECNDPTEYSFAVDYLLGWAHWQRLCDNKLIRKHIDQWRLELEIKIRSNAAKQIMLSAKKGSFQASKWLADRGWDERGAGRPSNAEVDREKAIQAGIQDEFSQDIQRMAPFQKVG